jgi:alpha-mannosidase
MRFADGALRMVEAPAYGIGAPLEFTDRVQCTESNDRIILENAYLRATLSTAGHLVSLIEKSTRRETMSAAGNQFELYDDKPRSWDAWDIDPFALETLKPVAPASACKVLSQSALRCEIEFTFRISASSTIRQIVRLDADSRRVEFHCDVDWNENRKLLKVAFPVNVRAMNATYEMQFGVVERPTHYNTMYDLARFEVPGHKFVDFSEHGFGVAILSESKYGYSVFGNTMRMSLLRAPTHPDPLADRGRHTFAFAIMPHAGSWQQARVVREALGFNCPLIELPAMNVSPMSFFDCEDENLVLDTIKRAEDSDAIVLRLYECHGSRGVARVRVHLPFREANFCNILEDEIAPATVRDGVIEVPYSPFKVVSLLVR